MWMLSRSWLPRLLCIGRDQQDDRGWPGWRRCRTTSTPTGCHGPTQSTWPWTDHSGACWQPVATLVVGQRRDDDDDVWPFGNSIWPVKQSLSTVHWSRRFSVEDLWRTQTNWCHWSLESKLCIFLYDVCDLCIPTDVIHFSSVLWCRWLVTQRAAGLLVCW